MALDYRDSTAKKVFSFNRNHLAANLVRLNLSGNSTDFKLANGMDFGEINMIEGINSRVIVNASKKLPLRNSSQRTFSRHFGASCE